MNFSENENLLLSPCRWHWSRVARACSKGRELCRSVPDFGPPAQLCPHTSGCHLVFIAPRLWTPHRNGLSRGDHPTLAAPPLKEHFFKKRKFKNLKKLWQSLLGKRETKGLQPWSLPSFCDLPTTWLFWSVLTVGGRSEANQGKARLPRSHSQYADIKHLFALRTSTHTCFSIQSVPLLAWTAKNHRTHPSSKKKKKSLQTF